MGGSEPEHPVETKLYVSEPGAVEIYDSETGSHLNSIVAPEIVLPTGICFGSALFSDGFESGGTTSWSSQVP